MAKSEDLGIIKFKKEAIHRLETDDIQKTELQEGFPILFNGVGLLQDYQVKFHVDPSNKPVAQGQCPVPFHLCSKWNKAIEELESQDSVEPHTGSSP